MTVRRSMAVLTVAVLLGAPSAAFSGDWIVDAKTDCKVWNPNPAPGETANWTGACGDGLAEGKGVLNWIEGGKAYERDEGEWHAGRQTGAGSQIWVGGHYKGQLSIVCPTEVACWFSARHATKARS